MVVLSFHQQLPRPWRVKEGKTSMDPIEPNDLEWIRNLARRLAATATDADDVVQDTWLAAHRARPDRTRPLRPWLAEVVRNLVRSRFRVAPRRRRRERTFHQQQEALAGPPDVVHARAQVHQILADRVRALEEPLRTIVHLRFFEDKSSTEIAATLNVPPGTVRWRLKTAIDQLRSDLDRRFDGDRRAWSILIAPAVAAPPAAPAASRPPARTISPLLSASLIGGTVALVAGLYILLRLAAPPLAPPPATAALEGSAATIGTPRPRPASLAPPGAPASALAEVEGVVLDPEGGPVPAAAILAIRQNGDDGVPENLDEHVPAAHSDQTGAFHITRLPAGRFALTATGRGHTPGWVELNLQPGQRRTGVRLTLAARGIELSGHLRDSSGGLIAGGGVTAYSVLDQLKSGPMFTRFVGRDGRYRLVLPPGEYAVSARASGYAWQAREVPLFVSTRLDFHLDPGARIAGRVEGAPAPGEIVVQAFPQQRGLAAGQMERTDPTGQFLFDSLSPGAYLIEARRGAAVGRSEEIVVGPAGARQDVVIRMQRRPQLSGTVRRQDGRPIAGAGVTARIGVGVGPETSYTRTSTDERGAFVLEGLWPGQVTLQGDAAGFASETVVLKLTDRAPPVELVLQPASQLRGRVLDPSGEPAAFARLTIITQRGGPGEGASRLHTLTDRRGLFSVDDLAGAVEVRADHGSGLGSAGPVQLTPGSPASVEVRLRPGAFVSGVVRQPDGSPATGAHVRGRLRGTGARTLTTGAGFLTWVAREPPPAETAADGSFRIGPFEAGEVAVRASVPDVPGFFSTDPRPDSEWLHLQPGEERTGLVLILDPADGHIAGLVLGDDARPLAGAMVFVLPEQDGIAVLPGSSRAGAVVSDADGRFRLTRLRRGRYTLQASHPELAPGERRHVPPGTEDVVLRLVKPGA
jgi:RNA polymerase sigma factor (sigma-70 family)